MIHLHQTWKNLHRKPPKKHELQRFVNFAARIAGLPVTSDWHINILFVGDRSMARYNAELVGHNGTTDVITFNYFECNQDNFDDNETMIELIINPDAAIREGIKHEGYSQEMALYIVHGLLHCSGEDDLTTQAAASMRIREKECLDTLKKDFDFNTLFPAEARP